MKLSIITINFRKPLLTKACTESLYKNYKVFFENNTFELFIVDNASGDESIEILEKEIHSKKYKNISLLKNPENSGFGGGNNFGANHAKGEYLLFLNNDTLVGQGLDKMLEYFSQHEKIGVLGGELKNRDGSKQSSVGAFYFLPQVFLLLLGMQRLMFIDKNPENIQKVDWVKGACLMIRKTLFNTLHGFDEKIFMYTEDMELCYRVMLLGKEVWFYPEVDIQHADQGSSNRTFAIVQIYSGILYFYKKHRNIVEYVLVKLLLQTKAQLLVLYGRLTKKSYFVETYEKALSAI